MCVKKIKKHFNKILVILGLIGTASLTQINLVDSPINYPLLANTPTEKVEYAYASQEKLRLEHNEMGRQFREKEITEQEWNNYKETDFNPKSQIISEEIGKYRDDIMRNLLGVQELNAMNATQTDFINQKKSEFKGSIKWIIDNDNIQI